MLRIPRRGTICVSRGLLLLAATTIQIATPLLVANSPPLPSQLSFRTQVAAFAAIRWSSGIFSPCRRRSARPTQQPLLYLLLSAARCRGSLLKLQATEYAARGAASQVSASYSVLSKARMPVVLSPGDGVGGEGLHWAPKNAKNTLIFMHGLGDTAEGWSELLQLLEAAQLHETTRLVLPTAPIRPVTLNLGMRMNAWSDIRGLTADANEDKEGLMASKARIDAIIESEIKKGVHPSRIVVGGFSQGGAVAYLVGLTSSQKLGGILSLSSWCPLGKEIQVSQHYTVNIPRIMHCHGSIDDLVRPVYGQTSVESIRNRLIDLGAAPEKCQEQITFKLYPGLGHAANTQELNDVRLFLLKMFGGQ